MNKPITAVFKDPPVLYTERLSLRRLEKNDCDDMYEYARLPEVTEYLTWDPHPDTAYTKRYLTYISSRYKAGDFYDWAVCLRDTGKMIGTCGFTRIDTKNSIGEIGYVINPKFHGKGLATEAVLRVIDFAFNKLYLHRIEAKYMLGNESSRKLMNRVGMSFEGVQRSSLFIRGRFVSVGICSLLKEETGGSCSDYRVSV